MHPLSEATRSFCGVFCADLTDQDDEFVPAVATRQVLARATREEALAQLGKDLITALKSDRVVDDLESVHVQEEKGMLSRAGATQNLVDTSH